MVQTSVRTQERLGRPGMAYDPSATSVTRVTEGAARPGQIALRGVVAAKAGKGVRPIFAAAAADPDGLKTNIASTAGIQTFTGADFQGAIGTSRMVPARNVVLVLSNHANWDATTAVVTGLDEYGREITENLTIPDAGNATVTGVKLFSQIISLVIPAQSGTAGTATFGTGTLLGPLTQLDVIGLYRYLAAKQIDEGATTEFEANDVVSIFDQGPVWVEVEEDVKDGEQVYTRLVAAGDEVVGAFRNDRDGTISAPDCVPVIGMRFSGDSETRDGVKMAAVIFNYAA